MFIKKSTILFSVLFIFISQISAEFQPNNPNIHTRKDPSFQENFSLPVKTQLAEQIELLKQKKAELLAQQNSSTQLSPEEIFSIAAYLSIIEQQIVDEQAKSRAHFGQEGNAECLPVSETEFQKNITQNRWNATDVLAYARELKLVSRKALFDKLIQTNRTLKTHARCLGSYVYTPKTQLQTVPVITTAEPVFALAAGSIILEKLVVPAATLATGLYVGSNHDANNSPIPQTPAPQAATPPANTPAAAPGAKAPSTNSTATYSSAQFGNSQTKPASPNSKPVPQEPAKNPKKATQETFKEPAFKKDPVFSPANNFSPSDNAQKEAVRTFQAQQAHDQARRDHAIEAAASVFVSAAQRYNQQQQSARKAKIIAEDAKRKEEDIQRRMRAGSKSRWQIEEEDRLFRESVERDRKEQARIEHEKQQEEREQAARKKEKKKQEKLDRKFNKQKLKGINKTSNSGPGQDPDDEDKKKKKNQGPHGIYENNSKHHQNSNGDIGKPLRDGQKMLDTSKSVPGEKYRINIENNKFVMLKEHSPGRWHGYIVEKFTDLPEGAKNALTKLGLVRSYKSGKIK